MKKFFKKVWQKVLEFWYFHVRNGVQSRLEVGGFEIEFHQYDLRIKSLSGNFAMKIRASEYAFGYLVSSLANGNEDNLHGYAVFMYLVATEICKDDKLRKDLQRAIENYQSRSSAKAKLDKEDGNEEAAIAAMKEDLRRANMSRAERRRAEKEFRKNVKEIIKEEKNND